MVDKTNVHEAKIITNSKHENSKYMNAASTFYDIIFI